MNHWETLTLLEDSSAQIEEFRKKYSNTYVWLQPNRNDPKKYLVLFTDFDGTFFYFNDDKNTFRIRYETDALISAYFPKTCLFNHKGKVLFFTRVPARQYKKAPNNENCLIIDPVYSLLRKGKGSVNLVSFDRLNDVYSPMYFDWDYATKMLPNQNKFVGFAITSKYALTLHPQSDDKLLLWLYNIPIGEVAGNKIMVGVESLRQEVADFINRNKIKMEIV